MKEPLSKVYFSFPVQLLVLHSRNNLILLGLWVALVLLIRGDIAAKMGFKYLFLDPEYQLDIGFWSFFFPGLAFGCFFLTWNLTTYLLSAHYFPFLASLEKPFTKFCLNNFLLPAAFLVFYFAAIIQFQGFFIGAGWWKVLEYCSGFVAGMVVAIFLYILYFHYTNHDIAYYYRRHQKSPKFVLQLTPGHRDVDLEYIKQDSKRWRVDTYLTESLQSRLVRSVEHYDARLLKRIFRQNHLNALLIQMLMILALMLLGWLIDKPFFRIPAGASIFFFLSIIAAIVGAVNYWFNRWRRTIMVMLLLGINFVTSFDIATHRSKAFGIRYDREPAIYSYQRLQEMCNSAQVQSDKEATIRILNNWKKRVSPLPEDRPKMIILCVSGGGLRSSTWTTQVVQIADSLTGGRLLDHTVLITGASGGMLGMAYLRELQLRQRQGQQVSLYDVRHLDNISKDLLNPIAFTLITNDLFMPWSKFKTAGQVYRKDRGYVFERQFNENTDFFLDKALAEYREPERDAIIPMLYLTPSIVNDVRRLVISPQGVSFMMVPPIGVLKKEEVEVDAVDFGLLFRRQSADSLRFLSAIRMNASYPYILPSVHLPTDPSIEVMDAGFRDNYGILSATRFVQVFSEWIKTNTSGVVIVQITSSEKIEKISPSNKKGIITSLFNPLEIAGQILSLQEFEQDNSLGFVHDLLGKDKVELIRFLYHPGKDNKIMASISFHITKKEKAVVMEAVNDPDNQKSMQRLLQIFNKNWELGKPFPQRIEQ